MHQLLLTFDVEDFVNSNEIWSLNTFLELLKKYEIKAIFFVTGHMSEILVNFPKTLELLKNHEIGFHSSGHSVRPIIAEYTDLQSYQQAFLNSLKRETAHIDPLTGETKGEGGIYSLQDIFGKKRVRAYRSPGMSWTPPHLEALVELGIEYDFSSNVSTSEPVHYRRIIFYPYARTQQWRGALSDYRLLLAAVLKQTVAVLDLHPTWFVNLTMWDSIYYAGNPPILSRVPERPRRDAEALFAKFELLLKQINVLRRSGLLVADSDLTKSSRKLSATFSQVQNCYRTSMRWPIKFFNYRPRFIRAHFNEFFENAMRPTDMQQCNVRNSEQLRR